VIQGRLETLQGMFSAGAARFIEAFLSLKPRIMRLHGMKVSMINIFKGTLQDYDNDIKFANI